MKRAEMIKKLKSLGFVVDVKDSVSVIFTSNRNLVAYVSEVDVCVIDTFFRGFMVLSDVSKRQLLHAITPYSMTAIDSR